MRIDRLDLIAYGSFTDKSLNLSDGKSGLHLIYGDNEAGKSTSLRALIAWLFGIPSRTNDNYLHSNPQLRIGGKLRLSDGKEIEFVRRKGTKGTLLEPVTDTVLDDSVLMPFLPGNVDENLFAKLYGIDHGRLVSGGKELLNQSGDLGQALFSAAVGTASFRHILSDLQNGAEELFKPRASTKLVNQAISNFKESQKQIKDSSLPVAEWKRMQKELADNLSDIQQIERGINGKSKEKSRLDRLNRVKGALANENTIKDIESLDIEIPILTARIYREYKNLAQLDVGCFDHKKAAYKIFSEEEKREIVFKDITTGDISHTTLLDASLVTDYRSVIGYFSQIIMKDLRLISGYDVLYGKVKSFIQNDLFEIRIDLDNLNTLRNLSEIEASKTLVETFKKQINALTIQDKGDAKIKDFIKLKKTRPFVVKEQGYIVPKKNIFNKIIGDSHLELKFAAFLEECNDIISYVKNYMAVHFQIDYVNADGNISNYYPDFIVKCSSDLVVIVETKGLEDLDVPLKMKRLREWCVDINKAQSDIYYDYIFVDEENFNKYKPKSFEALMSGFRDYKN